MFWGLWRPGALERVYKQGVAENVERMIKREVRDAAVRGRGIGNALQLYRAAIRNQRIDRRSATRLRQCSKYRQAKHVRLVNTQQF